MVSITLKVRFIDQSNNPPISIYYSSYGGGGGGAYFFFSYFGFLASLLLSTALLDSVDPEPPPTAPKNSVTFLPARALPTALTKLSATLIFAALRTAASD